MFLKYILLFIVFISYSYASDYKAVNSDSSQFKLPRLAGDSLPIAGFKRDQNLEEVNSINDTFSKGKIKGLLRYSAQHRDTSYYSINDSKPTASNQKRQYSAIGGYLGYETAPWFNTSIGATFYTAQKAGNNPDERVGLGGLNEDDDKSSSYTVLGEAFIKFKTDDQRITFGRQEMPNYRFISLSNIRFSPFTHEGTTYENTMIDNLQINLAYITKQKDRNAEHFEDMVRSARVKSSSARGLSKVEISQNYNGGGDYSGDNKGMAMLGVTYKIGNANVEVWDYYVDDFVNTIYLYSDYSFSLSKDTTLTFAGQFAQQNATGDKVAGDVNTWFYGLKTQISHDSGITAFLAYNEVKYDEGSYDGGTIFVRWGTPQMFNSFQVQDSELGGEKSIGGGVQFELGKLGLVPNTVIRFRYCDYNLPDNPSQLDIAQDRTETTFDLRYAFGKNDGFGIFTQVDGLSIQFRVAYDDFKTNYDVNRYKNPKNISDITDDFWDTRIYVDYIF